MANQVDNILDEYNKAAGNSLSEYSNTAVNNTGLTGFANAVNQAKSLANQGAQNQTASATNQAIQAAQQAGMSKAAAAMNAGNTAANTYQSAYNQSYSSNLSNAQNAQAKAMEAAKYKMQQQIQQAQTKMNLSLEKYNNQWQKTMSIIQTAAKLGSMAYSGIKGATAAKGSSSDIDKSLLNQNKPATKFNTSNDIMNSLVTSSNNMPGLNFKSDAKLKEAVKEPAKSSTGRSSTGRSSIDDFFDKLNAVAYKYTKEAQDEYNVDDENHVGLLAQDIEKSGGEDIIDSDENGVKSVDFQKLLETTTAGLATLRKELGLDGNKEHN